MGSAANNEAIVDLAAGLEDPERVLIRCMVCGLRQIAIACVPDGVTV